MSAVSEPKSIHVLTQETAEFIRVRGLVQGVGMRPAVWRLARRFALRGRVWNDGQGVAVHVGGPAASIDAFVGALAREAPPLARIEAIERESAHQPAEADFRIADSHAGGMGTGVVPDAATCVACVQEIFDPRSRRFRYPFANCTHCGPRLAIIESIPYDRAATTMRAFAMCRACAAEYADAADRRFHAQPIACDACGPRAWLERADGTPLTTDAPGALDALDAACALLERGHIVAIKGLGGFQLACDACNGSAVARLRSRKGRERKPFALMARDLDAVQQYCSVSAQEAALLQSAAAPIVILDACGPRRVATAVAPGVLTLGFMLPNTPLHHLLLQRMTRPIVLTSGNLSDEPQCIDNAEARVRLGGIADYFLLHDRDIARRVDDSVVRVANRAPRVLRRARGYAPAPIMLPAGFAATPRVLALGADLKSTFCLVRDGEAIVSHHMGDLKEALSHADYARSVRQYLHLFAHEPHIAAVDLHPEYQSRKLGRQLAEQHGWNIEEVQHHHAHIAACMADNGIALAGGPVLGIALDGLGYGPRDALWGGEFLLADYRGYKRLATFKPVAMPGGERASREPWRNTYAHLMAGMGWARFAMDYADLDLLRFLETKPRALLDDMIAKSVNSPLASSCGRLFDAVAAAAGVCRERAWYEGQAAMEFEAQADAHTLEDEDDALAYPFEIARLQQSGLPYVEPLAMWRALLGDLRLGTPVAVIAARFHKGLAMVIARMVEQLSRLESAGAVRSVALSGGVFQNRVLQGQITMRLQALGFTVLTHRQVPANDGGIALGQAVVAAARAIE